MIVKNFSRILFLFFFVLTFVSAKAQSRRQDSNLNRDSVLYKSSWAAGVRLRSDGFNLGAEFTRSKKFKRSLLYQVQFSYFWHPKQERQQSPYGGGGILGGDGFKPFIYGKQNTLFTLYAGVGQKFLLAEKGKQHGVQLFFKYAAGISLGILKPYLLEVVDTTSINNNTFSRTTTIGYVEGGNNDLFLNKTQYGDIIVGGAGFSKGWKLKALPALHVEVGIEFDFGKNLSFVKTLEIGVASDFYYKKVPVMVQSNKFLYPSVYAGFLMGKRKEK